MKRIAIVVLLYITTYPAYALTIADIFNQQQRSVLGAATEMVQASLGYDEIRELVYVTFWARTQDAAKTNAFNRYIAEQYRQNPKDIIFIYERLCRSMYMIEYMAELTKQRKHWKFYYYYTDTLLPDTKRFCELLQQAIIKADSSYAAIIGERQSRIKTFAVDIVNYKEALYGGGF